MYIASIGSAILFSFPDIVIGKRMFYNADCKKQITKEEQSNGNDHKRYDNRRDLENR